jgi:hypothetical protein
MVTKKKSQKSKASSTKNKSRPKSQNSATINKAIVPIQRNTKQLVQQVCSLTDPFCDHAIGARYFDSVGSKSLAYPQRYMFNMSTTVGGNASTLILPNYWNQWYNAATTLGGVPMTATYTSGVPAAPVITTVANYRIVSYGLRIKNIVAPLSSSGMVSIRGFSSQVGASYASLQPLSFNADFVANIPLQDCKDVAIIGKRANNTSAFYANPSTTWNPTNTPSQWVGPGWGAINIYVDGAPASTAVLAVELVVNFEIVIDDSDATAQIMTPPPPSNSVVDKATAVVTSTVKSVFVKGVEAATGYVKTAAIGAIGAYFGVPPSAAVGMARILD